MALGVCVVGVNVASMWDPEMLASEVKPISILDASAKLTVDTST